MNYLKLKDKNTEELKNILLGFLREKFNIRMQISSGKFKQFHLIKKVRRNIARLKTFLKDKG